MYVTEAVRTSLGAPSGTCSGRTVTTAVAAGRISRRATQSVSPASPSNGRRSNGAGVGRDCLDAVSVPR